MLPWRVGDIVLVKRGVQSIYEPQRERAIIRAIQFRMGEHRARVRFADGTERWTPCRTLIAEVTP